MGLRINTTIPLLNVPKKTGAGVQGVNKALEGLASGLRINRAADDAAGLAIAERLRTQVRQYTQEANNLQTGVSVAQTADQALGTQQDALGRVQELATQAANGTLADDQRAALNQEAQQLLEQVGATAENTEFNGTKLLNGTAGPIHLGTEAGNQVTVNPSTLNALSLNGVNLGTQGGAAAAQQTVQNAGAQIGRNRAALGAQENALTQAIQERETTAANLQESGSNIRDLDVARGAIEKTRNQMALQRSISAVVQGNVIPDAAAHLLGTK